MKETEVGPAIMRGDEEEREVYTVGRFFDFPWEEDWEAMLRDECRSARPTLGVGAKHVIWADAVGSRGYGEERSGAFEASRRPTLSGASHAGCCRSAQGRSGSSGLSTLGHCINDDMHNLLEIIRFGEWRPWR